MCLGGFPILAIVLVVAPLVFVWIVWLAFGGVMNGTQAVQMVNWNFPEIISMWAWLASAVSPVGALIMALLRTGLRPLLVALGSFDSNKSLLRDNNPLWPPLWATLLLLFTQLIVFEVSAYLKDRMATRPLGHVPSRFSKKRRDRLDGRVLEERERVLALVEGDTRRVKEDTNQEIGYWRGVYERRKAEVSETRAMLEGKPANDAYPPPLKEDAPANDADGLAVIELRKIYAPRREGAKAVEAVQNVTFGVRTGEVFGLLGANGAGKTTTMSMVMRAVEPTSGDATVGGTSVLTDFAEAASKLGVVNQHNSLWAGLSCEDHVSLFARLRLAGGSDEDIEAVVTATLDRVELGSHAKKLAGRLSGGMKRKLCCAAALVGDPSIVLLDEPSAGLDPVSQRNLWNLVRATMAGRAVVLTTHSMAEADVLCDRIGIMVLGKGPGAAKTPSRRNAHPPRNTLVAPRGVAPPRNIRVAPRGVDSLGISNCAPRPLEPPRRPRISRVSLRREATETDSPRRPARVLGDAREPQGALRVRLGAPRKVRRPRLRDARGLGRRDRGRDRVCDENVRARARPDARGRGRGVADV